MRDERESPVAFHLLIPVLSGQLPTLPSPDIAANKDHLRVSVVCYLLEIKVLTKPSNLETI